MRLPVPQGLSEWWDENIPREPLGLALKWRGGTRLHIGELHPGLQALKFEPDPEDFTSDAERPGRMLAKAFTRAGWLRPRLDPLALLRLLELRAGSARVEFILDTNAMVEGVGHWLADIFADRCDLVVTAVSLRELQDNKERGGFSKELPEDRGKKRARSDLLSARQLYLAASRFRERSGYQRVLWRELELDDTALLLSRGAADSKSSESDTLLLRAVRRSIRDRVNGLERFFVTGDTALARRAATELPQGSVIAAQVREVERGEVLFPCSWWPGPDQGYRVSRHPSRLVWELLCIGDEVVLEAGDGRSWSFRAFGNPMWPSDYLAPWVDLKGPSASKGRVAGSTEKPVEARATGGEPATLQAKPHEETLPPISSIWRPVPTGRGRLDHNLRLPASLVLDILAALVRSAGQEIPLPAESPNKQLRAHARLLLDALDLADVDREAWTARPRPRWKELADAWRADDRDALFDLLRAWIPLEEWATLASPPERPRRTLQAARSLAGLLGQGMYVERRWLPGGRRPPVEEMREAVREAARARPGRAIPLYTLLVEVFLLRLGVSPVRAVDSWDKLWDAGVFDGFEAREGGASSGTRLQEIARFTPSGWERQRVDLEARNGIRDLVYRGEA